MLTVAGLPARHGFFTRDGGVSHGAYASLNCSLSSGDDPEAIRENRARAAAALGVARLLGLTQVHGTAVVTVAHGDETGAEADAMVTRVRGVGLGIITADCAPVLLAAEDAVGAVHAGWRGAVAGVLEATISALRRLSDAPVTAAIGPCIGLASYEVGPEVREAVAPEHRRFFAPGAGDRFGFDLAGYCAARLGEAGVRQVLREGSDTFADPRFWSHRRRTKAGGGAIGHQLSAIAL